MKLWASTLGDAVEVVESCNAEGLAGSLAPLPKRRDSPRKIAREIDRHLEMLEVAANRHLDCDITLKLQCFGVYTGEDIAYAAVQPILRRAQALGRFVWIDMERPPTVDATIAVFRRLHRRYGHCGICLQAYLERTETDVAALLEDRLPIRLVKGFYRDHDVEPWSAVTRRYAALMGRVLRESEYPAIATHDATLIDAARRIVRNEGIRNAEFQFFQGVGDAHAGELAREGFRVRIYVPFGNIWRFLIDGWSGFDLWRQVQRMAGAVPRG